MCHSADDTVTVNGIGHVSILLTVASILCANRDKIAGTGTLLQSHEDSCCTPLFLIYVTYDLIRINIVKFLFQPAEEGGGGAKFMLDDGVLDGRVGPKVNQIFGLHLWNYTPSKSYG